VTLTKIFGCFLMSIPFIVIAALGIYSVGLIETLVAFVITGTVGFFLLGIKLVFGE